MDRTDLITRLEVATIRWRGRVTAVEKTSSARNAHLRLLNLVERKGLPARAQAQMDANEMLRISSELRLFYLDSLKQASLSFLDLTELGCRFEFVEENLAGERHMINLPLTAIPWLSDLQTLLPLATSLAHLPQAQQAAVIRFLDEKSTVRDVEVRHQFEHPVGIINGRVQGELDVAAARAAFDRAEAALLPLAHEWLSRHELDLNSLGWCAIALPAFGKGRLTSDDLLGTSKALSEFADCLVMPYPLASRCNTKLRKRWEALWQVCEDSAEGLSMVSAWLRCLGSTGEYKRCGVCFRHTGENMKKNCWLHHRTAKARIPARELHVSEIYQGGWKQAAGSRADIQALLNEVTPSREVKNFMQRAAEQEGRAQEITAAAATLAGLLRTLLPLMGPRIKDLIKRRFVACVEAADEQYKSRGVPGLGANTSPARRALRMLSWERFFGDLFGSTMSPHEATGFAIGKAIDIDHPLTSTFQAISVQKLALDLHHMNVWVSVDTLFNEFGYLEKEALRQEIRAHTNKAGVKPTLQDLALAHRTTPQAIHQALARLSSGNRRPRVLMRGKKELELAFLSRTVG